MGRGRPPKGSESHRENILAAILQFKSSINLPSGKFPAKTSQVWIDISQMLNHIKSPLAVFTIVAKNYYNVWQELGITALGSSPDAPDNTEPIDECLLDDSDESFGNSISRSGDVSSDESDVLVFTLEISAQEFEKMSPSEVYYQRNEKNRMKGTRRHLRFQEGWTDIVMAHFLKFTKLPCTLVFKRVKLPVSNAGNFATIFASCKECNAQFKASIQEEPDKFSALSLECTYIGCFKVAHNMNSKRHLSGRLRKQIADKIVKEKTSASVYRRLEAHKLMSFGKSQPNTLPSVNVLRVAVHERLKTTRLHNDPVIALSLAFNILPYQGVIRDIGIRRFFVHYWSPSQLSVYRSYCQENCQTSQVSIDATGSVVRRIHYDKGERSGHPFLYEVTVNDPTALQQYSVCNMVSERHDTNSIYHWLMEWRRSGAIVPKIVVTDMSPALMSAVVSAFTQFKTTADYLKECSKILNVQTASTINLPLCFVRCDIAHTVKLMTTWGSLKGQIKRTRHFYLRAMCQLLQSTTVTDIKDILTAIFTVAQSETEGMDIDSELPTKCGLLKQMLQERIATGVPKVLEDLILSDKEDIERNHDESTVTHFQAEEEEDVSSDKISFKQWVETIAQETKEDASQEGNIGNQQFLPKIVTDISRLLRLLPCCTAVMVPIFSTGSIVASSAPVESSFNDIKNRIFANCKLPIRCDDFVFRHIEAIDGTMKLVGSQNRSLQVLTQSIVPSKISQTLNTTIGSQGTVTRLVSSQEPSVMPSVPVSVAPVTNVQASCPACSRGDFPSGAHRCANCNVPVHIFQECSHVLPGSEEGYGEKRICFSCAGKTSDERDATGELNATENWRNKGNQEPPKKRIRQSYLSNQSEWNVMDLTDPRPVMPIGLLKNGNRLKAIRRNNQRILLSNSCAFDSVLQLMCVTYCDSASMKLFMDEESLPLFNLAKVVVGGGINQKVYNIRTTMLGSIFESIQLPSGVTRVDCLYHVAEMVKRLLPSVPSIVETGICSSDYCPLKVREINHLVFTVQCTSSTIKELQYALGREIFVERVNECRARFQDTLNLLELPSEAFKCTIDTGVPQCTGIRSSTHCASKYHFFVELNDNLQLAKSSDTVPEMNLGDIPIYMDIEGNRYWLRGVSGYTGSTQLGSIGHYVAFCRRHDNNWESYDDLKDVRVPVSKSKTVKVALLYYTI